MTTQTPGPWIYFDTGNKGHAIAIEANGKVVKRIAKTEYEAMIAGESKGYAESEANARLIAAAPELLEALQDCRDYLINNTFLGAATHSDIVNAAEAALAKAKGA